MTRHNDLKTIHHWSLGYEMLRISVEPFFRAFYGKIEVRNKGYIPQNAPVILAPNHQNALMDALALIMTLHGQIVFLARADIFKKRIQAKFLHFINIMPVYRIRDGAENLSQNDEIFEATHVILKDRQHLCIMPEGNHGNKRKLRPLVKGIFRIAFMAQQEKGNTPYVKIVPVGLDYSDYVKFGQKLFVNFGKPIDVSEYFAQWEANPAVAMNALRDRLSVEMSKIMIDIRSEDYYEEVLFMRSIYNEEMLDRMKLKRGILANEHDADRELIRCMQKFEELQTTEMNDLAGQVNEYRSLLSKNKTRDWVVKRRTFSLPLIFLNYFMQVLLLPVFLFGLLHNALPFFLPVKAVAKIRDLQFHSSVKMALGMVIFIIQFIILATLAFIFLSFTYALVYLIFIPVSGWFAVRYSKWLKKNLAKWKFLRLDGSPNSDKVKMIELRKKINSKIDSVVDKYFKS
jgi:1-acyl-sn-glycerol-3-phosphate acyltransferase